MLRINFCRHILKELWLQAGAVPLLRGWRRGSWRRAFRLGKFVFLSESGNENYFTVEVYY